MPPPPVKVTKAQLPASVRGVIRPNPPKLGGIKVKKGRHSEALFSQALDLGPDEVLLVEFDEALECARVGLMVDARRGFARDAYRVDLRVGIRGTKLRLWLDAWDGEGPTGEAE